MVAEGSSGSNVSSGRVGAIAGGVVGALLAVAIVVLLILIMVIIAIVLKYRHDCNSFKSTEANTQGMIII